MENATYLEKEQLPQEEATRYWFDVDGEFFAVVESGNEWKERATVVDCDGHPVDVRVEREIKNIAHVTDEMRNDF